MRIKFPHILPLAVALAATTSAGFAKELDLWFTPLSTEGPMKAPMTKWLKENLPKELSRGDRRATTLDLPFIRTASKSSSFKVAKANRT